MNACEDDMLRIVLLWTLLALGKCESWYDCIPGITGSIGVSTPRGDISLNVGSKPVQLLCHLNPNHTHYQQGYNADNLLMEMTGKEEHQKIMKIPSMMNSTKINSTTIGTMFNPSKIGNFDIRCRLTIKDSKERDGNNEQVINEGVCLQRIHVGQPPLAVENFSCISENWSNLNCTWDEPYNPVRTRYSLHYAEPGGRYRIKSCPSRESLRETLTRTISRDLKMCYIDERTVPSYRKPVTRYTFIFNATNPLKPDGTITVHRVNHFAIVRPGPAESMILLGESDVSLSLSYSTPRDMDSFPVGLDQEIRISNQHHLQSWLLTAHWDSEGEMYEVEEEGEVEGNYTLTWDSHLHTFTVLLDNLQYAWTRYTIQVRMISANADKTDLRLWSQPMTVSEKTLSRVPDSPPKTCQSSFQVVDNIHSRTVYVYWEQIEEKFQNGPGFNYTVTVLGLADVSPVLITSSFAKFSGLPVKSSLSFSVTASNVNGETGRSSLVSVPPQDLVSRVTPKSVTTIYSSEDESYKVSWYPPALSSLVTSYTIFWCEVSSSLPSQCSGRLQWLPADKLNSVDSPDTIPATPLATPLATLVYSLALDRDAEYQLAVAANTKSGSSGLVWSSCTVINNRMVTTVRNMEGELRGSSWLVVQWSLPCSERGGTVVGYNVTWCQAGQTGRSDCQSRTVERNKYNLTSLTPWTEYSITLTVLTSGQSLAGGTSSPITLRTRPSTPASPPTNLRLLEATNTTASLAWDTPRIPNGPISSYRVLYQLDGAVVNPVLAQSVSTDSPRVILTDLLPYTRYRVTVAGCNPLSPGHQVCADNAHISSAAPTTFRTAVGRPGRPNPPQVSFINSSRLTVQWNSDFTLGAAQASNWSLSIVRVPQENVTLANEPMIKQVSGESDRLTVDLRSLDTGEDWVCENKTVLHTFNISLSVSVTDSNNIVYTGPWSKSVSVQPPCSVAPPWGTIFGIVIPVVLLLFIIVLILFKTLKWAKRKKEFFTKLGQELDDKYVTVTKQDSKQDYIKQHQAYQTTNFNGRTGNLNYHLPGEHQDLTETLLEQRAVNKECKEGGHQPDQSDQLSTGDQQDHQLTEKHLSEQHLTEQHLTEQHLTEQHLTEQHLTEQHLTEQHLTEQHLTEQHLTEQHLTEQQLTEQQLTEQHLTDPARVSEGYIQISLANAPVANGYIQIQQLPANVVPTGSEIGLLEAGEQCPGYSKVGPVGSAGYIQFPGSSVVISPALLDQTTLDNSLDLPRNTVV